MVKEFQGFELTMDFIIIIAKLDHLLLEHIFRVAIINDCSEYEAYERINLFHGEGDTCLRTSCSLDSGSYNPSSKITTPSLLVLLEGLGWQLGNQIKYLPSLL
jgi:hypothetical protein